MRGCDGVEAGWAIPAFLVVFIVVWVAILQPRLSEWRSASGRGGSLVDRSHAGVGQRQASAPDGLDRPRMDDSVFPVADWSFHLLAMINAAVALWSVDLIARRFVRGDKRAIVLLLLLLLPVYQFHAQRFNANSVLFALWPLAVYCFLRSFETRQFSWAVAAGIFGGLCVLGKYYSAFLIVGFAVAAICHPLRRVYFMSAAPWVSTAVGVVLLAPHVHWLVTSGHSVQTMRWKPMVASRCRRRSKPAEYSCSGLRRRSRCRSSSGVCLP